MLQEKNLKNTVINASLAVFLVLLSAGMLYPMLHVIFTSLSEPAQLIRHRGLLFHSLGFDTIAYDVVLHNPRILSGYVNTLFILFFGLIFNIILTSLGAYFFIAKRGILVQNHFASDPFDDVFFRRAGAVLSDSAQPGFVQQPLGADSAHGHQHL